MVTQRWASQPAVVGLYIASDALRLATPIAEIGARAIPVVGWVVLGIQAAHSLYEGGEAFVEADNACNGAD